MITSAISARGGGGGGGGGIMYSTYLSCGHMKLDAHDKQIPLLLTHGHQLLVGGVYSLHGNLDRLHSLLCCLVHVCLRDSELRVHEDLGVFSDLL